MVNTVNEVAIVLVGLIALVVATNTCSWSACQLAPCMLPPVELLLPKVLVFVLHTSQMNLSIHSYWNVDFALLTVVLRDY